MSALNLKPTHAAVKAYYEDLHSFGQLHFDNEAQVSDAFAKLLASCGRKLHLTFVPQFPIERARSTIRVDGALLDIYHLENELHCNEVMLLPYYIASMNIEHAYFERTGEYKAFPGICLVDTFELAEPEQASLGFMTEENAQRVKRQKEAPIFVIIGNPPYNAWQVDESDNNKNRKYPELDRDIYQTYRKDSKAGLTIAVADPYVKAIRWASTRIGDEGVIALVTNDSFIDQNAFDAMRKQLALDFDAIYLLDLGGNVRKNPKLSGTTHNVFGIQVGVSINLFIRRRTEQPRIARICYARVDEWWRKEQKYKFLDTVKSGGSVAWEQLTPDSEYNWLTGGMQGEFKNFLPLGVKKRSTERSRAVFVAFSKRRENKSRRLGIQLFARRAHYKYPAHD